MRLFLISMITLLTFGCVPLDDSHEAKVKVAKADLSWLYQFVEEYRNKKGSLPDSLFLLGELKSRIDRTPLDPWSHAYQYEIDGSGFRIFSLGADGMPGGEGPDADIEMKHLASD